MLKLSTMGFFIKTCLLTSIWLSTGFLSKYSYVSAHICNYATSNATTVFTLSTAILVSNLLIYSKNIMKYRLAVYEMMGISSLANGIMAYFGPGICIPILPNQIKFLHALVSFSFGVSLMLILLAPNSAHGILTYRDAENCSDEENGSVKIKEVNNEES